MTKPRITLITGGCRSGKSTHALTLAADFKHPVFLATAEAKDEEMRDRVAKHQVERGERFTTLEEPRHPARALRNLPAGTDGVILDCVTVWLSNLFHYHEQDPEHASEIIEFFEVLEAPPCPLILVTNEVGTGIVPMNKLARQFRDRAGAVNRAIADRAHAAIVCICGIPLTLKSE